MKAMRQQKSWIALLALLFIFAACKGESPTAPPPGGGPGPAPPPTGLALTLTASNASPVVDSLVTVTATVTQNGAPAPDGTAVEFSTNGGSFSATETVTSILRTTVNGNATVQLRSTVAGLIRVLATVGNLSRTVDVTFRVGDVTPQPPNLAPAITAVTPAIGTPAGGQRILITGRNFREPVRVLFDTGGPLPVEAFVTSRTDTSIEVLTPGVNLGAGQQLVADVIVITQAGSATEARAELEDAFTFRNEQLTPRVSTASPVSGPVTGGTRVTLFGDGFQHPVQVLFGAAEAKIVGPVEFNQIIVESPAARDTSDTGSGTVTGPVPITVRNINSQTQTVLDNGFHYVAAIDITSFRPLSGPATGGTDVVIDGIGFLAGADVTIAGIRATVLQVTGTRILARTVALPSACSGATGPIRVTNPVNGDFEEFNEEVFSYVPVLPLITSVTSTVPGDDITVVVRDPGVGALGSADIRFTLNDRTLIPSPDRITNGTGTQPFSVVLPLTGFTFPQEACTTGGGLAGTRAGAAELPLTFNNLSTGCSTTTTVTIQPPLPNPCLAPPVATVTTPAGGSCATPGVASVTGVGFPTTTTAPITISNGSESQPLNITSVAISGSNASEFRISPTSATNIAAGGSANFTLTFDPTTAGAKDAVVTFTTNSTSTPTLTVCVQAIAAP
jgi:hypothetical protein